ncbi:hypothetical protein DFJ63DRAFT_334923 [Scheffersomyces coipomensis]|uniref:uncharacterized protein n=1 Tax=Scheffersomyces coipomensis TaxID=1788519 RepID=UPI00315C62F8
MSNNNNKRTHKRQKSSVSAPFYFIDQNQGQSSPQQSQSQQQQHQIHQSPQHNLQQATPTNHQSQIYDADPYSFNYNFPNKPVASSSAYPAEPDTRNIHSSPLKRPAPNDDDDHHQHQQQHHLLQQQQLSHQQQQQQTPYYPFTSSPHVQSLYSNVDTSQLANTNTSTFQTPLQNFQPITTSANSSPFLNQQPVQHSHSAPPTQQQQQQHHQQQYPSNFDTTNVYPTASFNYQKITDFGPPSTSLQPISTAGTITGSSKSHLASAFKQHQRNNLSISSHFNLFSLTEDASKRQDQQQSNPDPNHRVTIAGRVVTELLSDLIKVDSSNINNYLLSILKKINSPLPVDDFYNLLYNNDRLDAVFNTKIDDKIDKTKVPPNQINPSITSSGPASNEDVSIILINELLNIFKNTNLLVEYFPELANEENKLSHINYHELLRTFLAIKILYDVLVELPLADDDDPLNYTIPRLSIYKTYYIVCQKLIIKYPSSSNTTNEQQKLILGQSKLGKLIKLVYPNLLIKRLGSRGESKYNYLGVIWNSNIINDDINQLSESNDIVELNEIFKGDQKAPRLSLSSILPKKTHRRSSSKGKFKPDFSKSDLSKASDVFISSSSQQQVPLTTLDPHQSQQLRPPFDQSDPQAGPSSQQQFHQQIPQDLSQPSVPKYRDLITTPNLSFIKPFLKYPSDDSFTVLHDEENWFSELKFKIYSTHSQISRSLIHQIFLDSDNLQNNNSILQNLVGAVIKPLIATASTTTDVVDGRIDLHLYLIILVEILPYLLLIKSSTNIYFLKSLRLNLLHLINNLNNEIKKLDSSLFSLENSTIFLILLKKMINLNDLLITFIKLIIKDNTKSIMTNDIENFLKTNQPSDIPSQPSVAGVKVEESDDDSSFLLNLNTFGDLNFNFKNDILSNDMIYTLIGYNFDPAISNELKSSISMNFINEEINLIDEFFKKDLLAFLNDSSLEFESPTHLDTTGAADTESSSSNPKVGPSSSGSGLNTNTDSILNSRELIKLHSLINLIDKRLLSVHYKSKYPIIIYNNFISFILNDILKFIFLKQQQSQLQNLHQHPNDPSDNSQNSFGNWWVFNSFIQEYLSLMGEIVGLHDTLEPSQ